jgi:DNA-binding IclR family transcriptional regulator
MIRQIPLMRRDSVRFTILLWLCTDPPGTWTQTEMVDELTDMGTPKSTAHYAIQGLALRGLITRKKDGNQTVLGPTFAGTQALKPYLPRARA